MPALGIGLDLHLDTCYSSDFMKVPALTPAYPDFRNSTSPSSGPSEGPCFALHLSDPNGAHVADIFDHFGPDVSP